MPFNSVLLVSTANRSAELWQRMACLPERIGSDEMVDLVICFPVQQLGRWVLNIWNYLCVSPYPHRHHYYTDSDDDSASSSGYHYCSYCNQNRYDDSSSSSSD